MTDKPKTTLSDGDQVRHKTRSPESGVLTKERESGKPRLSKAMAADAPPE
jgi:hypothetical protein